MQWTRWHDTMIVGGALHWSTKSEPVMTSSTGDRIGPEASRLRLSHWAGPSVTGSAKLSQSFYGGIIIVILTKGKPVPLAWEFIYIGWGSHKSDFHNITQNGPKMCHRTVTGVTCDTSQCRA